MGVLVGINVSVGRGVSVGSSVGNAVSTITPGCVNVTVGLRVVTVATAVGVRSREAAAR